MDGQTSVGSTHPVVKPNKNYYADIYIDELRTGIEVKLAKDEAGLNAAIAAIDDDIKGCPSHPHYKNFAQCFM